MLHHGGHAAEVAVEAVDLAEELRARAVLLHPHFEDVFRPPHGLGQLTRAAVHPVAQVGDHLGDRPRGEGVVGAPRFEEGEPCERRVGGLGPVARDRMGRGIRIDELPHQGVAVARQHVAGQRPRTLRQRPHRTPRLGRQVPEEQRVGGRGEGLLHAAAEDPRVGERHLGDGLHGRTHGGRRHLHLPAHGSDAGPQVGRGVGDRVGRAGHGGGKVVVESARHHAHADLGAGQGVALRHRDFQQGAASREHHAAEQREATENPGFHSAACRSSSRERMRLRGSNAGSGAGSKSLYPAATTHSTPHPSGSGSSVRR